MTPQTASATPPAPRSGTTPIVGAGRNGASRRRPRPGLWRRVAGVVLLVGGCASLFVGSDVIERHLFPTMSTGLRHALLTARSALVTGIGITITYLLMRREQRRLNDTASKLARLLESYTADSPTADRFENPHLTRTDELSSLAPQECRARNVPTHRCWQAIALRRPVDGNGAARVTLQQCHECPVYLASCPDRLTELGESFNSLMFLLEQEHEQVDQMRAQMAEKEKMVAVGQMAAGIAHEIGNPLSSISSIVQLLRRGARPHPQERELALIQKHIERITGTVRQLSRLVRSGDEQWERVDLVQSLVEALQLVSFDRRASSIRFEVNAPESLPATFALRGPMQQVFINLALNALDAMPEGGQLTIEAGVEGGGLRFRFADTGCGIPEHIGRRVFEPFFTTKQPGRGTGLGLSVSYGIVEKHGGRIDFAPRPGGGTVFTVDIPLLERAPRGS